MFKLFGHHPLGDSETWLAAVRANVHNNSERSAQFGMVGASQAYLTTDGNAGIVVHTCKDLESAQQYSNMLQSAKGQGMLEKNGGKTPVTLWIAEEL